MSLSGELFWLIVIILMCIIEGLTYSLICIWFAGGALIAISVSALGAKPLLQWTAFAVFSAILLLLTRPLLIKHLNVKKTSTNSDRVIGNTGVVIKKIDPIIGVGQVKVLGQIWSAKPADGTSVIEEGIMVEVLEITGVKVTVREKTGVEMSRNIEEKTN